MPDGAVRLADDQNLEASMNIPSGNGEGQACVGVETVVYRRLTALISSIMSVFWRAIGRPA